MHLQQQSHAMKQSRFSFLSSKEKKVKSRYDVSRIADSSPTLFAVNDKLSTPHVNRKEKKNRLHAHTVYYQQRPLYSFNGSCCSSEGGEVAVARRPLKYL